MKFLSKIKLFFYMLNFNSRYLIYIGRQIGIKECLQGKKLNYTELKKCNKYLATGIIKGYEETYKGSPYFESGDFETENGGI